MRTGTRAPGPRTATSSSRPIGHAFAYDEVAPFLAGSTGGRVATYRGDLAAIYGLIEKPVVTPPAG